MPLHNTIIKHIIIPNQNETKYMDTHTIQTLAKIAVTEAFAKRGLSETWRTIPGSHLLMASFGETWRASTNYSLSEGLASLSEPHPGITCS